jgi:hypothetical protein
MVEAEGVGFQDFTNETAISGTASVSGNLVSISGEVSVSGAVSLIGDYIYRPKIIPITSASGGEALGSGLTTSGYIIQNVKIKLPEVRVSGIPNYGFVRNSGDITPYVYIGGYSGDAPHPGSGFICSGKGLLMAPGDSIVVSIKTLDRIYAAAESSGNPLSYVVEMR